jgi:competence protein ComEC
MAVAPLARDITWPPPVAVGRLVLSDALWRAPLFPVALALTAGIAFDRYCGFYFLVSLALALACLAAGVATFLGRKLTLSLLYFMGAVGGLASAYHHWYRDICPADDIGEYAPDEPRPVRLRGFLVEEPTCVLHPKNDPLQSFSRQDPTVAVLEASRLHDRHDWHAVSGRARLVVTGKLSGLHVGDEVEVVGRLVKPQPPTNPGEFDYASYLRDQRIRAIVAVGKTPDGVKLLSEGSVWSPARALPLVRGWGQRALQEALPPETSGVAVALLLGDGSLMTGADWDKYIRTGVIHVLAISGQHLVVLAAFLWMIFRLLGIRRRRVAWLVGLFVLAYAVLAGGRPPVMRSAVMVCVFCLAIILRQPVMMANSFALAWIVVALLNPTDIFGAGCQLSFLAVAVLYWGTSRWLRSSPDALERLVDETRPRWLRLLRSLAGGIVQSYAVTAIIWLAAAPLVAARYHTVPAVGLLIGPIVILLTSIALLAGFLLLLLAAVFWPLVPAAAWVTSWSLASCEWVVSLSQSWPGSCWYVGDIPEWWLWLFYLGLLAMLMLQSLRPLGRWALPAGLAWICVGLVSGWVRPTAQELRCTFLAVGHGGCTVLEMPDGRTLLYDAGAMGGPDVTRRQIAPFLWSRGIQRIDEVFLSHADLDHFNGLIDLLDRFAVGQVSWTPTFSQKSTPAVRITLETLERRGIPTRTIRAGDRLSAGRVEIEVLHPPARGPDGKEYRPEANENNRSLVLVVRHQGTAILLTGDLEGQGMEDVLKLPPPRVDVLMAPHHGSRRTNTPGLVKRCRPRVVVACLGPPRGATRPPDPQMAGGVPFLGTWPHGALTITSKNGRLVVETFVSGQRLVLPGGAKK